MRKKILILILLTLLLLSACEEKKSSITSDTRENTTETVETVNEVTSTVDLSSEHDTLLERIENVNIVSDYVDKATGLTIRYNLYVPENYDKSQKYPLVLFLADASLSGSNNREYWRQGYGGIVWASDALQKGTPAIIIAPTFNEPIVDESTMQTVGNYVPALKGLVESIGKKYTVDESRIYGTGQSMGGMALMALSSEYPDLFSALMFVDCEWNRDQLIALSKEKFCYFAAAGDERAKACMDEMVPLWRDEGAKVGTASFNAQWPHEKIDSEAKKLLEENANIYCITWEAGSVLANNPEAVDERSAAFDFAYRVNAMVEWILSQRK